MDKTKDICEIKEMLTGALKTELSNGLTSVNTSEAEKVVNMIHHLAETEYYCTVVEAMEEGEEPKYGYNNRRYSSGRYAPKGMGHYGYRPYMDQEPYIDAYMNDPNFHENMRSGYQDGYNMGGNGKYGWAYNGYQDARRHYTQTHSQSDKEKMDMFANEHLVDTMMTIKEIYKSSEPELKKRIRSDLNSLIGEMPT